MQRGPARSSDDSDDIARLTGRQLKTVTWIAGAAAISGLLFGYDTAVINGALVFLRAQFALTSVQTEVAASSLLWGCVPGAAMAGYLSDRFGRRTVLLLAGTLFFLSAIGAAVPTAAWQFLAARLLGGIAIGCASLIAPLYIAEIAPARLRGRLISLNQLAVVGGILVAYISNYYLARVGSSSWRWMFGLGAVPAAGLCLSLPWIPESPRWLAQQGRIEDARQVLVRISPVGSVASSLAAIAATIREDSGSYRELLSKGMRRPMTLAIALAVIQQVTGINTVLYFGSIVFQEHARQTPSSAIGLNILVGVVNLIFTIAALVWIDRLGRRPLLLTATGGMAAALLAFSYLLSFHSDRTAALMTALLLYVACFALGLGPGVWVCIAEFFPNRLRSRAMSVATVALWLTVALVTATFLSLIPLLTAAGVFLLYALICGISFFYILKRLPETKNRTLEVIEDFWRQPD